MESQGGNIAACPFCIFSDPDANFVAEHVEFCHPEDTVGSLDDHCTSAENMRETTSVNVGSSLDYHQGLGGRYVECSHGCGELVPDAELYTHLDLHFSESVAIEDTEPTETGTSDLGQGTQPPDVPLADENTLDQYAYLEDQQNLKQRSSPGVSKKASTGRGHLLDTPQSSDFSRGSAKRLGRAELGPYAHEKRMPAWLKKLLERGADSVQTSQISPDGRLLRRDMVENEVANVIPTLARLCEQDKSVQRAFFCGPEVNQIFKLPREGGFCGYRNIQMLISYIKKTRIQGHERFPGRMPTILQLQDMIEQAWDMGINSSGRVETGGIRGTRKYIGTPEAQALFLYAGVPCEAGSFTQTKELRAHDALYMNVAAYFRQESSLDDKKKIVVTSLPPIYLQHQGHSLTIIGFEIRDNGCANLLVFDPMFKTTPAIKRLLEATTRSADPARLLKAYRRGTAYFQKYKVFEVLKLTASRSSVER